MCSARSARTGSITPTSISTDSTAEWQDGSMAGLVLIAIVGALALWAVASYNRLVGLRNQVLNGWRQIDVQLKRRLDLIPNLVNAVRGSMDFHLATITAVIHAPPNAH